MVGETRIGDGWVSTRRGRLILIAAVGVLVLALVAVTAHLLLPSRQTEDVAVPAADATPEQVVTAYLEALSAHDCDTAEALIGQGTTDVATTWCEDVDRLSGIEVDDHVMKPADGSGAKQVANVAVRFDLDWRRFHNDGSMDEGDTVWGYRLVRDTAGSPWRIVDQGVV